MQDILYGTPVGVVTHRLRTTAVGLVTASCIPGVHSEILNPPKHKSGCPLVPCHSWGGMGDIKPRAQPISKPLTVQGPLPFSPSPGCKVHCSFSSGVRELEELHWAFL